ncbi:MAG: hypothetical protein LAT82_04845 [Nanoarchaeota archaeon]|nr:hypothetical protein [Nanoarchaeota archaeon]
MTTIELNGDLEKKIQKYYELQSANSYNKERFGCLVYSLNSQRFESQISSDEYFKINDMLAPVAGLAFLFKRHNDCLNGNSLSSIWENNLNLSIRSNDLSLSYFKIKWLIDKIGGEELLVSTLKEHFPQVVHGIKYSCDNEFLGFETTLKPYVELCKALDDSKETFQVEVLRKCMSLSKRNRIITNSSSIQVPNGTLIIPNEVKITSKSGSSSIFCGEFGLIDSKEDDLKYIIAVGIQRNVAEFQFLDPLWQKSRANTIRGISRIIYTHLKYNK